MNENLKDAMAIISAIATLIVALAALMIGRKQTSQAESQAQSALMQTEIAQTLRDLEVSRDTPQLVPAFTDYSNGAMRWSLVNAGGGAATDIWIEGAVLLLKTPMPKIMVLTIQTRIPVVRDQEFVSTLFELEIGTEIESIIALAGHYRPSSGGEKKQLAYEVLMDGKAAGGFLKRLG